jgi:diguanylate cyclase (GGDEF)-like protein/PAS domain S-box-containing protein
VQGVKERVAAADACNVSQLAEQSFPPDPIAAGADLAAQAALRELPDALVIAFDEQLRFVLTAGQAVERLGNPEACSDGAAVADAFPAEVWSAVEPLFRSALEGETRSREVWTSDDRHCLMIDVGPLSVERRDEDGQESRGGLAVVLDITARRRAHLLGSQSHPGGFEVVFERAPIGTGLLDSEGRWLLVNRALCDITGYTAEELIGNRFDGILHPEDVAEDLQERRRLISGEAAAIQIETRYFDASGETVSAILSMSLVRDRNGEPLQYIAQLQDISERKRLEEHLRHLADHDPLTGLRNRRLFEHDLKLQVARSQRYGEVAGLVVLDLDAFKQINDAFGHAVGDETLRAVSRALSRRLRETDLIARLGGDEFAVLLPHIDADGLAVVADGLMRVIPACSIDAGEHVVHPHLSVGFTLIDQDTRSAELALVEADGAMYATKRAKSSASS